MRDKVGLAGLAAMTVTACSALAHHPKLASGTTIVTTATRRISSATARPGDSVELKVSRDVLAADHETVVVPAGAVITLGIVRIAGAPARGENGTLVMSARSVEIAGTRYPLDAAATTYEYEMKPHDIGVNEVAKTGAGAVVGALVGHAIAGNAGTVVGAVGGGAAGAAIAAKDLDRDLVVRTGNTVTLTLRRDFVRR